MPAHGLWYVHCKTWGTQAHNTMNLFDLKKTPILRKVFHSLSAQTTKPTWLTISFFAAFLLVSHVTFAIAPVLSAIELTTVTYNEGNPATLVTVALNVTDVDSPSISSATIQITGNFNTTEDILSFTSAFGITGTYNAATGVLSLAGLSSLANYRTVLRTVTYRNSNTDNPSNLLRTISFTVNDGTSNSNTVGRNFNIVRINDVPTVANLEAATITFTESDPATLITSAITVLDVDNATLTSATVAIAPFNNPQDVLAFTNAFGITGSFSGGTLTLSGAATVANYEAALRSVTYQNTNTINPVTTLRTLTIRVNDGALQSVAVTRTITIIPVNDAPILSLIEGTNMTYAEGGAAAAMTATITAADGDDANLTRATIQITGNFSTDDVLSYAPATGITGVYDALTGTMTLTGTSSVANYRNALRAVTFRNTNTDNPSSLVRTVSFMVKDALDDSNVLTRNITFNAVNDIPVLTGIEGTLLSYTEGQAATPVTASLTITDVDNVNLTSATVQIFSGFNTTNDVLVFTDGSGITSSFNTVTGMLTLTGPAPVATFQAALRSVSYQNTNDINPTTTNRVVRFIVNDGTAPAVAVTRTITFAAVNDAPILSAIESTNLAYTEGQAATIISTALTVTDGDSPNLNSAVVQITGNFMASEDVLSYVAVAGITPVYNAAAGTINFSGSSSIANYQNILRSVRYRNSNNNTPSPLTRTVSYTISDAALASNTVTRNIDVAPVNDAPTVVNDTGTTPEEVAINISVLANDTDVDDTIDPSTVTVVTQPLNGTTTVNTTTGVVTYTPNAEFTGSNSFTYTVKDVYGSTSLVATVSLTVTLINDAPYFTAGPDITVSEDAGTQTIAWATGIDDGDPFTPQTLTFVITNSNTPLFASGPSINTTTGVLTFRSNNNANGIATITVALRDNGLLVAPHVNISGTKTFTIKVTSVNDAPVGVDDFYSTSSNTPLSANAKSNDTDPEANTSFLAPTPLVAPLHGTVILNAGGTFIYSPDGNFTGTDTFTYQVCDNGTDDGVAASRCGQGVVSVTVNPPNATWNIVGNNSIELSPNSFILTKALNNQQGAVWNRTPLDLRYSFELDLNAIFSDPGTVRDVGADGIIFLLQRDTTPPPLNVPDLPIYARGSVGEYLGVGGIDPSIGIEVDTYQNGGEPAYDHIAVSKNGSVYDIVASPVPALVDASNNPLNIEDGVWHTVRIKWDHPTNALRIAFDGIEKIVYNNDIIASIFSGNPKNVFWGFSSSTGGQNNYQAVSGIAMTIINLAPNAGTDVNSTDEDTAVAGSLMDNDTDPENATTLHVLAETKNSLHGSVVIKADGTYVYTPEADYNGNDSFTYQVCDSYAPNACSTGTVNITIAPVQDAPTSDPDAFVTSEDTPLVVACNCVLDNDKDVDGETLTAVEVKPVTHGALELHSDGTFIYTPDQDFFGTDTFTYHATDGIDESPETLVTITVLPVNDAPVAFDDNATVNEDTPTSLPILSNDVDVDDELTPTMVNIIAAPSHGTITITASSVTYTPQQDYFGPDSFTYTLKDPAGLTSNIANVAITVAPVNDAPVTLNDGASTAEEQPVTIDVLTNDSDVDNAIDQTTVVVVNGPMHGTVEVQPNGTIIYIPSKDYTGADNFDYTVKDVSGTVSAPSTVTVAITPVNDAPVASNDAVTTLENTAVNINITNNDIDVDNNVNPSSVIIVTNPAHGTLTVDAGGIATYAPTTDYLGEDTFTYTIQDPDGLISAPATVTITVVPPNRAPHAVDDGPIAHRFLLDLTIDVLKNDYDVDNEHNELTIVSVSDPNMGTVSIVDGQIVYHPNGTTSGVITFSYTIKDPAGLTAEAVVTIEYIYNPLEVSEGFSPNNDNNNDSWYILSIENYPGNNVKIFDRWGLLVYQKEHYENDIAPWDGRANSGQQSGKLLDQGTYYYMLDVGGEIKLLSGFVMIVR